MGGAGNENAARIGDAFEPRGDVYTIAIEIAALDHYVAKVDADAKHDLKVIGQIVICERHLLLQLDRTLDGVDSAGEFDQHPIAGNLEDTPLVFRDERLKHVFAARLERGEGSRLILFHET